MTDQRNVQNVSGARIAVHGRPLDHLAEGAFDDDEQLAELLAAGAVRDVPITGGYERHQVAALQAEADRRELEVTGTGAGRNVTKNDLIAALTANDPPQED